MAPKGLLCGKRSKIWSWVQIGYVRPTSDGSDSLQVHQKYDIMRVLSVSTGTRFITGLAILDFCEGYNFMKDKITFLKNWKTLERNFKPSVKELKVPKSSFFLCNEYMDVKIMSRVLVGFDETTENRGRARTDGRGRTWIFEHLPHKSPFGAIIIINGKDPRGS